MIGSKLVLFIPSLRMGGAERVVVNLAQEFSERGYHVTILLQKREGDLLKQVVPKVIIESLNQPRTLLCLCPLVHFMRHAKPDIFISHLGHNNIVSILARFISHHQMRLIICQHALLSAEIRTHDNLKYKIMPFLYRAIGCFADHIVAVSNAVAKDMATTAQIPQQRITTIYNPVIGTDFKTKSAATPAHEWFINDNIPIILGVGRLSVEKDFLTLVRAFAIARQTRPLRLAFIGDGPMRQKLELTTTQLNIQNDVTFLGFQANPLPYMRAASIVVLPTPHEGLGNTLIEALACGTNVICANSAGGQLEVTANGKYGRTFAAGNDLDLSRVILEVLDTPQAPHILEERGQYFSFARSADAYQALFEDCQNERNVMRITPCTP